jgi:molybdopterin synthase sulfur carrier subunit
MSVRLVYFAWIRERIGMPEETVDLPANLATVGDVLTWLAARGEGYAYALESPSTIRVAVDHAHVGHDQPLGAPREIALFPPMTGG